MHLCLSKYQQLAVTLHNTAESTAVKGKINMRFWKLKEALTSVYLKNNIAGYGQTLLKFN